MTDLTSSLPWLGASVAILVAIVLGLGFALHFQSRIPNLAQPAIAALMAIIPPLALFLVGRNLALKNLDFNQVIDPGGVAAWILRGCSAMLVGLSVAIIMVRLLDRDERPIPRGRMLMIAFFVYYATNVLLSAAFGTVPGILVAYFYPLIVVVGLFMVRDQGYANLLIAYRWMLTIMMVASVALIPVMPNLVLQPNSPEARLPFVTFRFFGLGSGPNSIGPLSLTLILLAIHLPFRSRLLQLICLASATAVLVLAQSQTAWIAAALIIPPFLVYRWTTAESNGRRRQVSPPLMLGLVGLGLAAALAVSFFVADWPVVFAALADFIGYGQGLGNRSFSGRGAIWVVAVETFIENPLFGYGVTAWDRAFRAKLNMPYAFHAHNQLMQSLSVGGLLGALGLIFYVSTLAFYSVKFARFTRGLAPALLTLILVRCISEVPLDVLTLLAGDFITHVALLMLLAGSAAMASRHARTPAAARIQAWVSAPVGRGFAPARSVADEGSEVDEQALGAIVRYGTRGRDPGAPPAGPGPIPGYRARFSGTDSGPPTGPGRRSTSRPWTEPGRQSGSGPWTEPGRHSGSGPWTEPGRQSASGPWTEPGRQSDSGPWTEPGRQSDSGPWTELGRQSGSGSRTEPGRQPQAGPDSRRRSEPDQRIEPRFDDPREP